MMNFFKIYRDDARQATRANDQVNLTRTHVETGDERCPLAGVWSRLPKMDAAINFESDDDPGLAWPARGSVLVKDNQQAGLSVAMHLNPS